MNAICVNIGDLFELIWLWVIIPPKHFC